MKYLLWVVSLALIGCGSSNDSSNDSSDNRAADEAPEAEISVSESLHGPLDKAKAVEDALMKAKEDRDEALEAAGD